MSEEEQKLQAFLGDLVTVCQKHGMAVLNADEYGITLMHWGGWADKNKVNPNIMRGPMTTLYHITPDGAEGVKFYLDGQL